MFDRFTDRARLVISFSQVEAERLGHGTIGPEHLLLGLVRDEEAMAVKAFASLGVDRAAVLREVERVVPGTPAGRIGVPLPFTQEAKRVCEDAAREAVMLGHPYIASEHLLLALAGGKVGHATQALSNLGLQAEAVRAAILEQLAVPRDGRMAVAVPPRKRRRPTARRSTPAEMPLADVRDGLVPVQRHLLSSLYDLGLTTAAARRKASMVIAHLGVTHQQARAPASYRALVRMAQGFTMRHPLVDGMGNFGSRDGDRPAPPEFTAVRMTRWAEDVLGCGGAPGTDGPIARADDGAERSFLPCRLPNLLVNGGPCRGRGDALGVPPHNLGEVCQAIIHLLRYPACTVDDLIQHVHGPDFPTGGEIEGGDDLRAIYATGRGRLRVRATIVRERYRGRAALVVTETPFGLTMEAIQDSLVDAINGGRVTAVTEMTGGLTNDGVRLLFELAPEADPDTVLGQIWEHTKLQRKVPVSLMASDDLGERIWTLKELCQAFIAHRMALMPSDPPAAAARLIAFDLEALVDSHGDARRSRIAGSSRE